MRTKYNDPVKLKDTLNKMFGEKNYKVRVINNRYILMLSRAPRQVRINLPPSLSHLPRSHSHTYTAH
ncbi:hypothetical protein CKAH01_13571 [Colletotrichum kahawae]|uniref:Uncharacterized protein n=1 Tax=Colletotrichum kahawae TaxID=34407 RepID=A0AAD9YPW3_COLKA|nr:hypothetical protein CKAH01_13571 [Colletotrichum kahawae]